MTFSDINEDLVEKLLFCLHKRDFRVCKCWELDVDSELSVFDGLDPIENFEKSSSKSSRRFIVATEGPLDGEEGADVVVAFDLSENVVRISLGDKSLLREGTHEPWVRLLAFFQILRTIAENLKPIHGTVGPECYSTKDLSVKEGRRELLQAFTSEIFSTEEATSIRKYYGF